MRKERKHYTAEEKVAILRRHLLDKVPVSDLCEELGLRPRCFYRWQKEFFENGAAAFQSTERPHRHGIGSWQWTGSTAKFTLRREFEDNAVAGGAAEYSAAIKIALFVEHEIACGYATVAAAGKRV